MHRKEAQVNLLDKKKHIFFRGGNTNQAGSRSLVVREVEQVLICQQGIMNQGNHKRRHCLPREDLLRATLPGGNAIGHYACARMPWDKDDPPKAENALFERSIAVDTNNWLMAM